MSQSVLGDSDFEHGEQSSEQYLYGMSALVAAMWSLGNVGLKMYGFTTGERSGEGYQHSLRFLGGIFGLVYNTTIGVIPIWNISVQIYNKNRIFLYCTKQIKIDQ